MALQSQAQLLDELMGKHRNAGPGARVSATKFDDDDVCKYALVSFCPHDLFINTRADLGPCSKIHDDELRKQYEKSSRYGKIGFEDEFEDFVRGLLSDVEKRIRRGKERLRLTQSDLANQKTPAQIKQERVDYLKEQINSMIKEAEHLGEEGRIEEAQNTLEESEKLKAECKHLEIQLENNQHGEHKQMEVCDVCGSFLIINDAQSRIEEHIGGKQHVGYAKLREALEQLRVKRADINGKRDNRDRNRDRPPRSDYDRDRHSKDSDQNRSRNRSRSRDRGHKSDHRHHRGDRDRDRDVRRRSSHSRSPNGHSSKSHSSSHHRHRDREDSKSSSKHSGRHRSRSRSGSRSRKSRHHSPGAAAADRSKRQRKDNESNGAPTEGSNGHVKLKSDEKSPIKAASSEREEGEAD